jgi:BMFP domain-containing protein YqiC
MPLNETLIEDVMTLGGNLLGNVLGARGEFKAQARQRMDMLARRLDLVSREEFDAAFAMLAKSRVMQDELSERLSVIEAKLGISSRTKKTARKKSKTKKK